MSAAVLVLVVLAVGTYALKAAGPLLLGGRSLPAPVARLTVLLPAALLAALVAVSALTSDGRFALDARVAGLAAAGVACWRRLPFIVVIVAACAAVALVRALAR
jgi:hypothetical protein